MKKGSLRRERRGTRVLCTFLSLMMLCGMISPAVAEGEGFAEDVTVTGETVAEGEENLVESPDTTEETTGEISSDDTLTDENEEYINSEESYDPDVSETDPVPEEETPGDVTPEIPTETPPETPAEDALPEEETEENTDLPEPESPVTDTTVDEIEENTDDEECYTPPTEPETPGIVSETETHLPADIFYLYTLEYDPTFDLTDPISLTAADPGFTIPTGELTAETVPAVEGYEFVEASVNDEPMSYVAATETVWTDGTAATAYTYSADGWEWLALEPGTTVALYYEAVAGDIEEQPDETDTVYIPAEFFEIFTADDEAQFPYDLAELVPAGELTAETVPVLEGYTYAMAMLSSDMSLEVTAVYLTENEDGTANVVWEGWLDGEYVMNVLMEGETVVLGYERTEEFSDDATTLEIPAADILVDFYVYDTDNQEWELVAESQKVAHYSEDASKRDYITVEDVAAILGEYGYDKTQNQDKQIAYRIYDKEGNLSPGIDIQKQYWYSDTTLNTQVPTSGTDVIPLSLYKSQGYPKSQGYAIAFLPGNTKSFSAVQLNSLAEYCGLDKRNNGTHDAMTMTLFNYGSGISSDSDKLGFLYGTTDNITSTVMDKVDKETGIGNAPLKMQPTLEPGGYPTGTYNGNTVDTAYLFSPNTTTTYDDYTYEQYVQNHGGYIAETSPTTFKRFSVPIIGDGGLFYKDSNGYLIYDSAVNAATYNGNGGFNVYNHTIAPKHIELMEEDKKYTTARQNGNFLPFNDASELDYNTYQTLEYEQKTELGYSDVKIKNYALSENTDLWFGMTMEVDFYMPKNGEINGTDMIFDFYGDDDVWVYIDDVLVLDIGGTHGSLGGAINFGTGEVTNPASKDTKIAGAGYGSSMLDADGEALTNLKDIFDHAGKDTSDFNDKTFGNYTKHKLKFFYMERGGNISYCRLKFNLPTLPANSLTVGKDIDFVDDQGDPANISKDAELFAKQNLEYTFRVLDEDGNPLIKDIGVNLVDDFGNPIQGMVVQVDKDGYFTLRADQKVRFDNMLQYAPEDGEFKYYVEESIPNNYTLQYNGISYGEGGMIKGTVNEETEFTTYRTELMKPDESNLVVYTNRVISERMSFLKIHKEALPGSNITGDETFPIRVTLGGVILEEGTKFIDVDTNAQLYVEEGGLLYLKLGQTVMLNNPIIAGTGFRVEEVSDESSGWQLGYINGTFTDGTEISVNDDKTVAIDRMPVNTTATVNIYNKTYDIGVDIPLSKQFASVPEEDDNLRTATFTVEQVADKEGGELYDNITERIPEFIPNVTLECTGNTVTQGSITLGYTFNTEGTFYYQIVENSFEAVGNEDVIADTSVYVAEITVLNGNATLTAIYKNGEILTGEKIASFVNILATDLTITKTVTGNMGDRNKEFSFTVTFGDTKKTISLAHGESEIIENIPLGATVTVTEDTTGYTTSYTINTGKEERGTSAEWIAEAPINDVEGVEISNTITFTNHKDAVPDTGVLLDSLPYILILAVVAGGVIFTILRKRRNDED